MTDKTTLLTFYDLRVSPIGFDFVTFMVLSDLARQLNGCDAFQLVLVPDGGASLQIETHTTGIHFSNAHANWRISSLFLPLIGLFPNCHGLIACTSRNQAKEIAEAATGPVYPARYHPDEPQPSAWVIDRVFMNGNIGMTLPQVHPSEQALEYVDSWVAPRARGRRVVSITLREGSHNTIRNSNIPAWLDFLAWIDKDSYFPVILSDIERVFDPIRPEFQDYAHFNEAVLSPQLRAAFYERCYLNLSVGAGPEELFRYNGAARYLKFKAVAPHEIGRHAQHHGLPENGRYPFSAPYHKTIEEGETLDLLKREFLAMAARIDSDQADAFRRHELKLPHPADDAHILTVARRYQNSGEKSKLLDFILLFMERKSPHDPIFRSLSEMILESHYIHLGFHDKLPAEYVHQYRASTAYYEQFLTAFPEQANYLILTAMLNLYLADMDGAQYWIDVAYRHVKPGTHDYIKLLTIDGWLKVTQGDINAAIDLNRRAYEAAPSPNTKLQYAIMLDRGERVDDALRLLAELLADGHSHPTIHYRYATLLKAQGRMIEAIPHMMAAQNPNGGV